MRLVSFDFEGSARAGVLRDGHVDPVTGERTLEAVLADGPLDAVETTGESLPLEDLTLLPPVTRPDKIVCIGLNYRAHAEEQGKEPPETPTIFAKFANALVPAGGTVKLPSWTDKVDYEAEVAFVIGARATGVSEADAMDHVAGYTLLNDLSARDYQFKTPQWMPGKVFDGAAPCGPALVTPDEAGPHDGDRDRADPERRADAGELHRRSGALDPRAGGLPVPADDPGARRPDLYGHARGGGQPARPEGVAAPRRPGGGRIASAGRAGNALRLKGRDRRQ